MRQLDQNVFKPFASNAMRVSLFGHQNVAKLYEQEGLGECAYATVMLLNYYQPRWSANWVVKTTGIS